jgi:hypothetical protein
MNESTIFEEDKSQILKLSSVDTRPCPKSTAGKPTLSTSWNYSPGCSTFFSNFEPQGHVTALPFYFFGFSPFFIIF